MMRIRTGHGPSDWTPNVPAPARLTPRSYSSVHALTGAEMMPVLRQHMSPEKLESLAKAREARKS